jgi:hypothetical protein
MAKQIIQLIVVALFLVPVLSSCYPCDERICPSSDNLTGYFTIKSADGKNLLFGPDKRYDESSMSFYSLEGADTTYLESDATRFPGTMVVDSVFFARFDQLPDTAYMRFSDGDVDTLALTYLGHGGGRCCAPTTDLINIRLNGKTDYGGNAAQFIK